MKATCTQNVAISGMITTPSRWTWCVLSLLLGDTSGSGPLVMIPDTTDRDSSYAKSLSSDTNLKVCDCHKYMITTLGNLGAELVRYY